MRGTFFAFALLGVAHEAHGLPSTLPQRDLSMPASELPPAKEPKTQSTGSGTGPAGFPAHSQLRLKKGSKNNMMLVQIADVHLTGNTTYDSIYMGQVKNILDKFDNISLAVLSGDQIVGAGIKDQALPTWNGLTNELVARGIVHTSILGNHDAEPYLAPDGYIFEVADTLTNDTDYIVQTTKGARTTRGELMANDAAGSLSRSRVSPSILSSGSSVYALDVLPEDGGSKPLLTIFHLDTGDGGIPVGVDGAQQAWFAAELAAHREIYAPNPPPVIVFGHLPLMHLYTAWLEGNGTEACWGEMRDSVPDERLPFSFVKDDQKLMDAIWATPEVVGVFAGHLHCNNYCCRSNTTTMCFAQHASPGGYHCAAYGEADSPHVMPQTTYPYGAPREIFQAHFESNDYPPNITDAVHYDPMGFGSRVIELTHDEDLGTWQLETRIVLTNGTIVHAAVLGKGSL